MGGAVNSAKGFLGLGSGPTVGVQNGNAALDALNSQNAIYSGQTGRDAQGVLQSYLNGDMDANTAMSTYRNMGASGDLNTAFANELATGATTGSKFAADQVNNNSILGGLYGSGPNSQLSQAEDRQNFLTKNGYSLTKEDNDALGQVSGNIARQYGSQENSLAQALADHGMSAAPSGAAAIQFTGLAGNKNEALANMQTQIAQQRIQNNQNAIAQNQSFLSSLGGQASNTLQQQYQRQLSGAQQQRGGLESAAQLTNQANSQANQANLGAANFAQKNKPQNFFDIAQGGLSTAVGAQSKTAGEQAGADGQGMFGAGKASLFGA